MPALFTHEPVVNKSHAITANRLIVHGASMDEVGNALEGVAGSWPTERMVMLSLSGFMPDDHLASYELPDNTLIELPADFLAQPEGMQLARELVQRGTGICISRPSLNTALPNDIPPRFGLLDASLPPAAYGEVGVPLAVDLEDMNGFGKALRKGYAGAAGWFFLRDRPQGKRPDPATANILRLLDLVREEAEMRHIEEVLKRDVALSYKLLRHVNSAAFGLRFEIQNFRQAVALLGYKQLYKWLSLFLVNARNNPESQAIRQAAVSRGRLMEILGEDAFDKTECDSLFITGAFSLLDLLLDADLPSLLDSMRLPEAIVDALVWDEGPYAPFLRLALACENDPAAIARHAKELGISPQTVNRASLAALSYADNLHFD